MIGIIRHGRLELAKLQVVGEGDSLHLLGLHVIQSKASVCDFEQLLKKGESQSF